MKLNSASLFANLKTYSGKHWSKEAVEYKLQLFKKAASDVPAYRSFLNDNNIDPGSIKTIYDYDNIPPINKINYLKKYSLEQLSWEGNLKKPLVFTSTSGSTQSAVYFHRSFQLDWQASIIHELFFNHSSYNNTTPVLVIVCFGMGVWIGGLITYQAFYNNLQRGYNFSIITPGINKKEIFNSLKELSKYYKQIILTGYPPFIKDILDESSEYGIDFSKLDLRILFAAESFTEDFRDYIIKAAHIQCPYRDTMNIYGSADLGAMAFETPVAVLIRRLLRSNSEAFHTIFGHLSKTPTLAQYIPSFTCFESNDAGKLLITGDNSIPLVRYDIGDNGGVIDFDEMNKNLSEFNIDLTYEIKKCGLENYNYKLPFVFVYERSDFSISFYGLKIYPEAIRVALLRNPFSKYVTGKFVMETKFDDNQNQYWVINIELRKGKQISDEFGRVLLKHLVTQLEQCNSEYRELHRFLKNKALPVLVFHEAGDKDFFKVGSKQQWVRNHTL